MDGTAVAVEAVRVGVSVEVQGFDLVDSCGDQAMNDIAFEVELRLAGVSCGEESRIVGVVGQEARAKVLVDLVGGLADAWTDRRVDILSPGAEPFHRGNGRIRHSRKRSAPAGVRCTHDCGVVVGEEHRRAIGGENPDQQVGPVGDHRIGAGPLVLGPWPLDRDRRGRMHLVDRRELGAFEQGGNGKTPVLVDRGALVIAPVTDVEARKRARRSPSTASQEAVRQTAERDGADHFDRAHSAFRMMMSSSAWLPTMKS
jgi:hypothetical protein